MFAAQHPFSLMMLDIDHFKAINDRHGHPAGDDVIRAVAARCAGTLRDGDLLARFGGEEFAVLLPETGLDEARTVAERLLAVVTSEPIVVGEIEIAVGISVGGASRGPADLRLAEVFARADAALYAAKDQGRRRAIIAE